VACTYALYKSTIYLLTYLRRQYQPNRQHQQQSQPPLSPLSRQHRETVSLYSSWHGYQRHHLCLHWGPNWSVSERDAHHASQWRRSAGILEQTPCVISAAGATRRGSLN